jgi:hypothetical protein
MEMLDKKIIYLYEKTQDSSHSGRSLFDHLVGTSNIIKKLYPTKQYLIDAGLFHSIYGTYYYNANLEISRSEVKSLIGEKAENLVYIFCTTENRTEKILQNQFSKNIQRDLYVLEYANLLEQGSDINIINKIKNNLTKTCQKQIEFYSKEAKEKING